MIAALLVAAGLAILFAGGHYLVLGAVRTALLLRVSPALVALTLVSMGTSFPELAVSMRAALRGSTDISYANVIGSNVFNIGAILGVTILTAPIAIRSQTIRFEYPVLFVVTAVALLLSRDGLVDRVEGGFLVLCLAVFTAYVAWLSRTEVPGDEAARLEREAVRHAHVAEGIGRAWGKSALLVVGGLIALVLGADLAVRGAVHLARILGATERVIGLTVIAAGTSLPELATSLVAARRRESEIALGNVIGSNIFNLLGILGLTAAIVPVPVNPRAAALDDWVMLAFTILLFPLMHFGRKLTRGNGVLLLLGFAAYWAEVIRIG